MKSIASPKNSRVDVKDLLAELRVEYGLEFNDPEVNPKLVKKKKRKRGKK